MKFNDYQRDAHRLAFHDTDLGPCVYPALGLVGEAGEVADKVKKLHRDLGGRPTSEWRRTVALELGDVLWYLQELAGEIGFTLDEIAAGNLAKLESRAKRGALHGEGDDR